MFCCILQQHPSLLFKYVPGQLSSQRTTRYLVRKLRSSTVKANKMELMEVLLELGRLDMKKLWLALVSDHVREKKSTAKIGHDARL